MPNPTATLIDGHRWAYRRELPGSAAELWPYVSESEKTALWFGPFATDPATGSVAVSMTAEEAGPPMDVTIVECDAPRRLKLDTGIWVLELEVTDGAITLFHSVDSPEEAAAIGPGWEFYLDRLAAAVAGASVADIDFEADYFPAMSEYFTSAYER
ncbi:hypothetical protein QVA66_11665 [Staphylococcus chromogenes]|nr:hypothetical protein [Staphylococcus chromogenes]